MYGKQAEVERHITSTLEAIRKDQEREQRGLPVEPIASPRVYFGWDAATTKAVDDKTLPILHINLAFILAHEAAHHVLGHTQSDYRSLSTEQKFEREEAADKWAAQTLIASGQIPAPASFSLILFERMYDSGMDTSHPSNSCRARALMTSSIDAIPQFRTALQQAGKDPDDMKRGLSETVRHMDESHACPSVAGGRGVC